MSYPLRTNFRQASAFAVSTHDVLQTRRELQARLFPAGIPRLWCPTLTHFSEARTPDGPRLRRHLEVLAPHVQGILVPGSTGEGWEMDDADIRRLLEIVLNAAGSIGLHVLIGVLKTSVDDMLACLDGMHDLVSQPCVAGVTICPPRGSTLSQQEISDGLSRVLDRGLPTALYQLPQVTGNEMSAETVWSLAAHYPNFILFKDTSGADRVAMSRLDFRGVFLVRGAEGQYARWPKMAGGCYDGFLLSTANAFASQLAEIQQCIDEGREEAASALSTRIETVVTRAFDIVATFPVGNPFTNANKLLDHVMAYGKAANLHQPPLLYSGVRLPHEYVAQATAVLHDHELLPNNGYLE